MKGHVPHPGTVPYSVASPLWSDGAAKERFFALPEGGRIGFQEKEAWKFPEKTALVKTFRFGPTRVETRILVFQEGEWTGYSYAWNAAQDEAHLVEAGGRSVKDALRTGEAWRFPSRDECMVCHTRAANYVLGLRTSQMNRDHDYAGVRRNQLEALEGMGLFTLPAARHADAMAQRGQALAGAIRTAMPWTDPLLKAVEMRSRKPKLKGETQRLPKLPAELPRLADPADRNEPLESRTRSYLHANCAHCHVWAGGGNAAIDLHADTAKDKMKLIGIEPLHDRFGIAGAKLVAPGAPQRSVLLERMKRRGRGQMPPLASSKPDKAALEMLSKWIRSLE